MFRPCKSPSGAHCLPGDGQGGPLDCGNPTSGFDRTFTLCNLSMNILGMCADDFVQDRRRVTQIADTQHQNRIGALFEQPDAGGRFLNHIRTVA